MRQLIPRASIPYQVMLPPVKMAALGLGRLGDQASAQQAVAIGTAGASVAMASAVAAGLIATSAIPFIGPAIAVVSMIVLALVKNSGCGQTCIETSQWANEAEKALQQNIVAYFSQPAPRSVSSQQLALQNFDMIWAKLSQMCGDPSTGNAGKRCISDRQAGACTWKQTTTSTLLAYPGEPQAGACWNWFSGYRDPIANDPDVVDDSVSSSVNDAVGSLTSGLSNLFSGVSTSSLFLLAGAGLLLFATMGDN